MTEPEKGTITGVVQSVIFKGMHYEIIVESGDNEVVTREPEELKLENHRDVSGAGWYPCNPGRYEPEYL